MNGFYAFDRVALRAWCRSGSARASRPGAFGAPGQFGRGLGWRPELRSGASPFDGQERVRD